jgi:hypothetical protein
VQGRAGEVGTWGSVVGAGEAGGPIVIGVSPPRMRAVFVEVHA